MFPKRVQEGKLKESVLVFSSTSSTSPLRHDYSHDFPVALLNEQKSKQKGLDLFLQVCVSHMQLDEHGLDS